MSKLIRVTEEYIESVKKEFEEILKAGKFSDGRITFTKTMGYINRKATVWFSEIAWLKMQTLIKEFDKEVAWHGIAKRAEDPDKDEYIISDILVYPQEVTGATVTTDQEKYQTWLMSHDDDVFNNIRMQGHSHVNMGTTPSAVDTTLYGSILEQLESDMFYIFMIWNKKGDKTVKIYDLAKNVFFDTSDVTVKVIEDDTGIEKWLKESKAMVKDRVYTPPKSSSPVPSSSSSSTDKPSKDDKKDDSKKESKKDDSKSSDSKKRKGKRSGAGYGQMSIYRGYYDYDYDDDSAFYARGW